MATPTTKEIDRRLLDYGSPQGDAAHRQGGSPQRLRLVNCNDLQTSMGGIAIIGGACAN